MIRCSKNGSKAAALAMILSLALTPAKVQAGVTAAEADRLKGELTPVGAERAGNRDGTIPAWTGKADLPAAEAALFTITPDNAAQYADRLPEGALALFRKFPTYRMDIYPTHRTGVLPDRIYENIFRNATNAHAAKSGIAYGIAGAVGGIPFPIPHNGYEAMWNHLLAYWGPARELQPRTFVVSADGTPELASEYKEIADFPYYYPDARADDFGGFYFKTRHQEIAPPVKYGEAYLAWQPIDIARDKFAAWRYLPGEHRARKGPSLSYDTPDPEASGFQSLDEYYVFFGGLDRYDFEIVGKREMFVPYGNQRIYDAAPEKILGPHHAEPGLLRYELHRVWVIEAKLVPGQHHVAPRRRFYLDEDTWFAVYGESWDEEGRLWKFAHGTMRPVPELPAVILGSQFVYDLVLGGYVYGFAFNTYKATAPHPASLFTPESLAAQAVR